MYWDIQGVSQQYACELEEYLGSSVHDRLANGAPRGNTPNQPTENPNVLDTIPVSNNSRRDVSVYHPSAAIPLATSYPHHENHASVSCYSRASFLELCFNGGRYRRTLEEIDITSALNDGQLFNSIANIYREKRERNGFFAFRKSAWRFRKPSRVSFRKVTFFWVFGFTTKADET